MIVEERDKAPKKVTAPKVHHLTRWEYWRTILVAQIIALAINDWFGEYIASLRFWQ